MIGTGAAIDYLAKMDMDAVHEHEIKLNKIMTSGVKDLDGIEIIGPEDANLRSGICSLLPRDLSVHDMAILLDESAAVMVRSGQHCVHSWFNSRGHENGSLRASAYMYNTEEEARLFSDTLEEIVNAFS
jgi:cysteine desulfurase/selenocysteine lyase